MAEEDFMSVGSWISILLVLLASAVYWYFSRPRDLPPGPWGLPLFGYLPFLGNNPAKTLSKLSHKYGGIFSLYLGNRFVVVLNDAKSLREAFVKQGETFAGRPNGMLFTDIQDEDDIKYSLIMNDGQHFKDHRRFALHILRDRGFGKISLEPLILDEVQHFLSEIKLQKGAPYDLRKVLTLSVANNIMLMMLGRRFDYIDPWLLDFTHNLDITVKCSSSLRLLAFFPRLKRVPGLVWLMTSKKLWDAEYNTIKLVNQLLTDYKQSHLDDKRGSYFNAFKQEQEARQLKDPTDLSFSEPSLKSNLRLFMGAGTETTSTTLTWLLLYMMAYPEVQARVQREIDDVIGSDRLPSCQDMAMTPYTMATIAEVQRIATLVPLSVPHSTKNECRVMGYRIPKDTIVVPNLWAVHNDPAEFPDPTEFRPDRHLDDQGMFVKPENMVAFSLGKRQCLGEPLARMELYLYTTAMMQTFTFRSPDGVAPALDGEINIVYTPKIFITCAKLRR